MLKHFLEWYDKKNVAIGNGNEDSFKTFVLNELDNKGIEDLFNHLNFIGNKINIRFQDEYDFDYDLIVKLESNVLDDLRKFMESFYLAKLLINFIDYHDCDVKLNTLIATFDVEIAKLMSFKISCQKLLFNALNNGEIWHTEFYNDFSSFEHFVRYCLNSETKLKLHCGVFEIVLREISRLDFIFDWVDTIIQNNIYIVKSLLLEVDEAGVDSEWERIDLDLILFEDKHLITAHFEDSSIYEIAKELYYKYHGSTVVNLSKVRFGDKDKATQLWNIRSC